MQDIVGSNPYYMGVILPSQYCYWVHIWQLALVWLRISDWICCCRLLMGFNRHYVVTVLMNSCGLACLSGCDTIKREKQCTLKVCHCLTEGFESLEIECLTNLAPFWFKFCERRNYSLCRKMRTKKNEDWKNRKAVIYFWDALIMSCIQLFLLNSLSGIALTRTVWLQCTGAAQPEYTVTADDCETMIAIECVPMDERNRRVWNSYKGICRLELFSHVSLPRTFYLNCRSHLATSLSLFNDRARLYLISSWLAKEFFDENVEIKASVLILMVPYLMWCRES